MNKPTYWYTNPELLRLHWRRGTLSYILALSIIAILSLFSHYLVQNIVAEQEATARVVNLAGRQRMLSQRITRFAGELLNQKGNYSTEDLPTKYLELIRTMTTVHYGLMNGSANLNIPQPKSAAVKQIFNDAPIQLDRKITSFLSLAESVENVMLSEQERERAYTQLQQAANEDILHALDALVLQFQKGSETAIAQLQYYNRLSLIGMFVTLLLEALFIFRPLLLSLYRRERQYHSLLKEMDTEISERVRFQAFNDSLTELPNRLSMLEKIETTIQLATQERNTFVVISMGLDRFKDINNSLGHDQGDDLLINIASRLQTLVSQYRGFIGRITGDEFSIVIEQQKNNIELMRVVRQLSQQISEPLESDTYCIQVTASIGLAMYPEDGTDARSLLMHANQAMRIAKDEGGNCFRFFQPIMTSKMTRRVKLEQELRLALSHSGQLMLFYQPKIDLKTGNITGVEALIRWHHPEEGMLSPVEFIPIAEDSGLILDLGDWVLVHALDQIAQWQKNNIFVDVAINVSVKQLLRRNVCDRISALAQQMNIDPTYIQLEITENNIMENMGRIMSQLNELNRLGFTLAIDDFGTGHSSLARLRDLPIQVLKIDKSFVTNAMLDAKDAQIVEAIIEMGHSLNKTIIAEGIETPEQMKLLETLCCDEGQGYLFSKPQPANQLTQLLKEKAIPVDSAIDARQH